MLTRLLAEQPVLLSVLLAALGTACLYAWLQTTRKVGMIAGLICFALIPLGWYVADVWVTDRERILQIVYETADAVERNDLEAVYEVIDPSDAQTLRRARRELPRYEFSEANVGQIRSLTFTQGALPPEAVVDMTASVVVTHPASGIADAKIVRRLVLRFHKINDRWFVSDYSHMPLVGGPESPLPETNRDVLP